MKYWCFLLFISYTSFAQKEANFLRVNVKVLAEKKDFSYKPDSTVILSSEQNSVLFEIESNVSSKSYSYQVKGLDTTWHTLENNDNIIISNLLGGNYVFTVRSKVNPFLSTSIKFEIEPLIWQNFWFLPLFYLFSIAIIGMISYLVSLYRLRSQLQLQSVRHELEMDALRAQMNPHFIFNCLNTIDSYILLNKTDEASEFLNKFSKLIRRILESSRQEYIPIEQDIDALELYIKLEQERSNPKFCYEIYVDESLQTNEYFIPSMLIQPFVENAILHGLRHKRNDVGELFLNLQLIDSQLVITLIDNGIGREASQKINSFKQLNKQSIGLKLTEQRIIKLNEIYNGKAFLKVTDIVQDADRGTIIKIGLPLITQNDLSN